VGQRIASPPPSGWRRRGKALQSFKSFEPAASDIAASTPSPPRQDSLAALTIAPFGWWKSRTDPFDVISRKDEDDGCRAALLKFSHLLLNKI